MNVGIVIVAHAPMATALQAGGNHCFPDMPNVLVWDVDRADSPEATQQRVRRLIEQADSGAGVLVLTDIVGASPSNAATRAAELALQEGQGVAMLAGANTPMLLRALTYRNLPLEEVTQRALAGGQQAMLRVEVT